MGIVLVTHKEPRLVNGVGGIARKTAHEFFHDVARVVVIDGALRIDYKEIDGTRVRVIAADAWLDYDYREEN